MYKLFNRVQKITENIAYSWKIWSVSFVEVTTISASIKHLLIDWKWVYISYIYRRMSARIFIRSNTSILTTFIRALFESTKRPKSLTTRFVHKTLSDSVLKIIFFDNFVLKKKTYFYQKHCSSFPPRAERIKIKIFQNSSYRTLSNV